MDEFPPSQEMNIHKWQELQKFSQAAVKDHGAMMIDNITDKLMLYQVRAPAKEAKFKIVMKSQKSKKSKGRK
jgi:hypothetical protein